MKFLQTEEDISYVFPDQMTQTYDTYQPKTLAEI
jgi:hypothetical protein